MSSSVEARPQKRDINKFQKLLSYNFDEQLVDNISNDIKNLKSLERKNTQLDKKANLLYGGKEIFPSPEKI